MSQHRRGDAGWPRMGRAGLDSAGGARTVLRAGCVSLLGQPVPWYPACAVVPSPACHFGCRGGWWHCWDAPTSYFSHKQIKVVTGCRSCSIPCAVCSTLQTEVPWFHHGPRSHPQGQAFVPQDGMSLEAALSPLLFLQDPAPTVQRENRRMSHLYLGDTWRAPGAAGEGQSLHL